MGLRIYSDRYRTKIAAEKSLEQIYQETFKGIPHTKPYKPSETTAKIVLKICAFLEAVANSLFLVGIFIGYLLACFAVGGGGCVVFHAINAESGWTIHPLLAFLGYVVFYFLGWIPLLIPIAIQLGFESVQRYYQSVSEEYEQREREGIGDQLLKAS